MVICLPSDGVVLPGKIRDLSLGGCSVDTTRAIECGARAEIVARVNAVSFRAVGEVKAIRGGSTACLAFVYLTSGGKELLADMIADLARVQAVMDKLKATRREMDAESFRRELEQGRLHELAFSRRFSMAERFLAEEAAAPQQSVTADQHVTGKEPPLVIAVDLFG